MAIVVCDCRDAVSVLDYLLRYPDMRETVNQIVRVAREHLPDAQLELLVYTDPEIDDSYLVLYARFPEYTPEVMERIRAARRACLPFTRGKSEWILLTTDFRRVPRTTQLSS
jgi:acyl carrier protein phosphodiesterase